MAVGRLKRIKEIIESSGSVKNYGQERIKEIIENGIPTKDHGHIGISNKDAEEIKRLCKNTTPNGIEMSAEDVEELIQLCDKEISIQDRSEYLKTYYIKNPQKYNQNQKGKKNARNSEV